MRLLSFVVVVVVAVVLVVVVGARPFITRDLSIRSNNKKLTDTVPNIEIIALKELYQSTEGSHWIEQSGWNDSNSEVCTWFGVECTDSHVTGLYLSDNNLDGRIPQSFGELVALSSLDLGYNSLRGQLPSTFSALTSLYAVSMRMNDFTGALQFASEQMRFLHLDFNRFSGNLNILSVSDHLTVLGLTDNKVVGQVPSFFSSLKELETLFLGGNLLSGKLPNFAASQSLLVLDLSRNSFSGPLLSDIAFTYNLQELLLFSNLLSGSIPDKIGTLEDLVVLDLHDNLFTGSAPDLLPSSNSLEILHLQDNNLYGFVPDTYKSTQAHDVDLTANTFFCPVPGGVNADCTWLAIDGIEPPSVEYGNSVLCTIYGSNFIDVPNLMCKFGTSFSPTSYLSPNAISCTSPPQSVGTVSLSLTYDSIVVSNTSVEFTYYSNVKFTEDDNDISQTTSVAPKVKIDIFGEAKCPDMASIEEIFLPITQQIGSIMDLNIGFIAYPDEGYPTGMWSLHGQAEILGDKYILCAHSHYGSLLALQFADCTNQDQNLIPVTSAGCANSLGMDSDLLADCVYGEQGADLCTAEANKAEEMGAVWSPTIFIDGDLYCLWHSLPCKANNGTDFGIAICNAYTGVPPPACQSLKKKA